MAKTAVITGGSGGLGLASARALVDRGYAVVLTARRPEPLKAAAASIGARWICADCADQEEFARVVEAVDRVDLLLHSAGTREGTFVRHESVETFDRVVRANLRSAFVVSSAVLSVMPVGGRILFVSSTTSLKGLKGLSAYSAAKAGLNVFARTLAAEVERDGIHVHILVVGATDTAMLKQVPYPLFALAAEDVANAVAYLDSLPPHVVVREIKIRAAEEGPYAPDPLVSETARARLALHRVENAEPTV